MLLDVIVEQMDNDREKWEAKCAQNSAAGKASAAAKRRKKQNDLTESTSVENDNECQQDSTESTCVENSNTCQRNVTPANTPQHPSTLSTEYDYDNEYDNYISGGDGRSNTRAREGGESYEQLLNFTVDVVDNTSEVESVITWNGYPTTQTNTIAADNLALLLMQHYTAKPATPSDSRIVFELCHSPTTYHDERIAMLDQQKVELLKYAWEQAANRGNANWAYVQGMYKRFGERGIRTVEDAYAYDWQQMGCHP